MTMRNWIKPLARAFLAITLIVVAALASRAAYVHMDPSPVADTSEDSDILREVVDCGPHRRQAEYWTLDVKDNTIRTASCLES
ncbi:hypothetical protein EV147_5176 [Cupriavidus agavae]|uniref:Uncharacterized protein n=1 Tax=Cupriavidus agavae TaxID=1001822 RepID=A0A4Q7R7S6_9BURK|nr:hypothetical protein EV147_5176 [Cupriavidus agavae]